jgi:ferredoxin
VTRLQGDLPVDDVRPVVDEDLCNACGQCVEACRFEVLKLRKNGARPRGIGRCIACGHCVAVCPTRAISHPQMPAERLRDVPERPAVGYETLLALLDQRRSVRRYTDEPVDEESLRALVDAAILAPSGHNAQPWHFTFVTDPDELDAIRSATLDFYARVVEQLANDEGRDPPGESRDQDAFASLEPLVPALQLMLRADRRGGDRLLWGAPAPGKGCCSEYSWGR